MYPYCVESKEYYIAIVNVPRDLKMYTIRRCYIPSMLKSHEIYVLFNHLLEKNWISKSLLYSLKIVIQEEFPANDVDWQRIDEIIKFAPGEDYTQRIFENPFQPKF
jgi:hypothetical protein